MEEQFKNEDRILKELVSGVGLEQPSPDFKSNVMELVAQKASASVIYKPLISKKGWAMIAICFAVAILVLYLYPSDLLNEYNLESSFESLSGFIPEMTYSKNLVYGMIFLSLFIFQVPLLKKYLDTNIY